MRKALLPVLLFALACGDGNVLQPENPLSVTPEQPAVQVAAMNGAVKMVPFKGRNAIWGSTGSSHMGCEGSDDYIWMNAPSVINVSHMGRSNYDTENCWAFDDASPIGISLISQTGWVEGANGDKVYWYGRTPEAAATFDMAALTYQMGPFQITGGTGRFQGATGWLVLWGTMSADISTGTENWDGMISTVGSIK